jgi:hypothetical protein
MSGEHRFRREKAALLRVDPSVVFLALALFAALGIATSLVLTYYGWTPVDPLAH